MHQPLHRLSTHQSVQSAGRLRATDKGWQIYTQRACLELDYSADGEGLDEPVDGALARVYGHLEGDHFVAAKLDVVHRPQGPEPALSAQRQLPLGQALQARQELRQNIHRFFKARDFVEVQTQALVAAPGTDVHLAPVPTALSDAHIADTTIDAYLHTSPELSMKRLLAAGSGPIYQLGPVWRNGEVTARHNPEFSLLEWYRPWESLPAIMEDVQALVGQVLSKASDRPLTAPIQQMTMTEVVAAACGFNLLDALNVADLRRAVRDRNLLSERAVADAAWDEIFYALSVSHLDSFIADQGALFVTDWPAPLAVLAEKDGDDPRLARRFELYIDGLELANGFGELTDADEQHQRFEDDNRVRQRRGLPRLPMPRAFLEALQWGMPPSAGVALGVDRLLMLATAGAATLRDIAPFAMGRNAEGAITWG